MNSVLQDFRECLVKLKVFLMNPEVILFLKKEGKTINISEFDRLEEDMSQEDYKRGVEDALKAVGEDNFFGGYPTVVENVRKKLLTKKVTKWVNIYGDPEQSAFWYDSEEEAIESKSDSPRLKYIGAYPIEIDVPF